MTMNKLQKLIQETLAGYKKPAKKSCSCGCNTCDTDKAKPMSLNENMAPKEILSEGLKYHMDKKQPLTENVYRAGSERYFDLWAEARALYSRGILEINNQDDIEILTETHLGHFDLLEDGTKVPLDFIMEEITDEEWPEEILSRHRDMKFILQKSSPDKATYQIVDLENNNKEIGTEIFGSVKSLKYYANNFIKPQGGTRSTYLGEAKDKKKTPPIGKPKRGGSKKFYVYVRDKGKIKKVSFGDTSGLSAKINNPEARRAFAKRHDCANKKDRTKASYWSCRLPRYAKLLGLKSNFSGFW
jgi:hypothetical protein